MKRLTIPRVLAIGAVLLALAIGCSRGSGGGDSPTTPELPRETHNVVISIGPGVASGGEIVFPVEFADAVDLYAFSFRIGFDPSGLRPAGVEWSETLGEHDATFHLTNQQGFLPLAFARYDGIRGLDGAGALCTLRFAVLDPGRATPWIIADPAYLVAFNAFGEPLNLLPGGEAQ